MKNLTIKKVALGLFLAGYAASSAFAISATTSKAIQGNLPVFKSKAQNAAEHTMTLKIVDTAGKPIGKRPAKVKDIIKIEFNLEDADNDKMSAEVIQKTFTVFIKKDKTAKTWTDIETKDLKDLTTVVNSDGNQGTISFEITDAFAGAEYIGYRILERTDFGAPYANKWLWVSNIWGKGSGPVVVNPDEKDPTKTPETPEDKTPGGSGPGDSNEEEIGSGPIESDQTKIGIFKLAGAVVEPTSIDYSREDKIPQYGDKFAAVVWLDVDNDGKLSEGDLTKTGSYTFTWTLTGKYDYEKLNNITGKTPLEAKKVEDKYEALAQNLSNGTGAWDTGINNVIFLGSTDNDNPQHNNVYDTSYYPAGAQGYNLTVTTN